MAPPQGGGATTPELERSLAELRQRWEAYELRGLGVYSPPDDADAGAFGAQDAGVSVQPWRGFDALTHAAIPAALGLQDRLPARACGRAWRRACERGPAREAWLQALGGEAGPAGESLGSRYALRRYMAGGSAAEVFKAGKMQHSEVKAASRLRARSPVLPLADGTAAALVDLAPPTLTPDTGLAVFDMSGLTPLGHVPITGAKHGKSLQRPVVVASLQAARVAERGAPQAAVAAIHRLVVVFSWRLGQDEGGAVAVRDCVVGEVRWGEGGREVLRSASFVGLGCEAPVAVLMEAGRNGPAVEVYAQTGVDVSAVAAAGATSVSVARYALREIIPLSPPKPGGGAIPGAIWGGAVALWAKAGDRAIDFVRFRAAAAAGDADGAGGTTSAAALFARSRQTARRGLLRVHAEDGAGLDMEASKWGYIVEAVDEAPGQPDVCVGDCVIAIGGQTLHGLDEEVMNWRFGRNFSDGAEIVVMPAEQMKAILEAESGAAAAPGGRAAPTAAAARASAARTAELHKKQHFVFSARLEAWCLSAARDPPRLIASIDNRLVMADLCDDGAMTREALPCIVKPPMKRPVEHLALLSDDADVVLAGVAQGVLVWRVPALAVALGGKCAEPELLASVKVPQRCSLVGVGFGLGRTLEGAWAWIAADLSGAGADTGGSFDAWQVFTGRSRPLLEAAASGAAARGPGLAGDALTRAFAAVGAALQALSAAMAAAAAAAPAVEGQALRPWASSLKQESLEPLYAAVDRAEPVCAEAVRDLRRWLRAEGRGAACARQDGARELVAWVEECRRYVLWPLQVAFQADGDDSDGEDLPTRQSLAANQRSTGAAAGTVPQGAQ